MLLGRLPGSNRRSAFWISVFIVSVPNAMYVFGSPAVGV
jgi:hypothetical protein